MKNLFLTFFIILLPLCLLSQEIGIEYSHNKYLDLNNKELKTELIMTNIGTGLSVTGVGGGAIIMGTGLYISYSGIYHLTRSILESTFTFLPMLDAFYYGGVIILGSAVAGIGYLVVEIALNTIHNQAEHRDQIKVALQAYHPTSYKDNPGMGIGISIALN